MYGTLFTLGLFIFISSAFAAEFTHIKLKPEFESALLEKTSTKSNAISSMKSAKAASAEVKSDDNIKGSAINAVLGISSSPVNDDSEVKVKSALGVKSAKALTDFTSPFPNDGEESALYEQIRKELEASHQQIGLGEVTQLDVVRRQFNLGVDNFSGFSWQKPFGAVQVWADRQVVPNLEAPNWLVTDTFTIDIAASTFLEKLTEAGVTDMSALDIGAFAGITFRRVYTTYHYAASYNEGLRADFSRLFLPFLKFSPNAAMNLGYNEIMKKEDVWTAKVGGMLTSPPVSGFSASVGVLAQGNYEILVTLQSSSQETAAKERLRVSLKQTKGTLAGVNLSLQLDFFKLLKLTIFNYDLEYEFSSAKEFVLAFPQNATSVLTSSSAQNTEFKKIINGYGSVKVLEPYVTQLEEREESALGQRVSVLLWGKLTKTKTEQVRVIKDGTVRTFYKNYAQSVKVVQTLLSRILGTIVYKIFKFPMGTKNAAFYSNEITVEYDASHPQAAKPEVMKVDDTSKVSILMSVIYEAARTDRWVDRKYKNDMVWIVDSFTSLPKDYLSIIRNEQLKGPMKVTANIRIEKSGLDYMFYQPENSVVGPIADACNTGRKSDWLDASKRAKMIKRLQISGKEICMKTLVKAYYEFKNDLARDGKPSMALLKNLLAKFMKEANNINEMKALFGPQNVFVSGQLQATSAGGIFSAPFSSGNFNGLGVIDNYKKTLGSRTPASVLNE